MPYVSPICSSIMKFVFFTFSLSEVSINTPVSVFWVLFYGSGVKMKNVALFIYLHFYFLFFSNFFYSLIFNSSIKIYIYRFQWLHTAEVKTFGK